MTGHGMHRGCRALAARVLLLALSDLEHQNRLIRDSARRFLTVPSAILELWTGWLGVDQETVIARMTHRLAGAS